MGTVKRFEDLEIWQLAREISNGIYQLTKKKPFCNDLGLINQIRNSSGSAMDNIAEGFERDGKKEFSQFLSISKGSAGETRSQLYRALDRGYILKDEFDTNYVRLISLNVKIRNMMSYLGKSEFKGTKYKT